MKPQKSHVSPRNIAAYAWDETVCGGGCWKDQSTLGDRYKNSITNLQFGLLASRLSHANATDRRTGNRTFLGELRS